MGSSGACCFSSAEARQRGDELRRHQAEADQIRLAGPHPLDDLVDGQAIDVGVDHLHVEALALENRRDVQKRPRAGGRRSASGPATETGSKG